VKNNQTGLPAQAGIAHIALIIVVIVVAIAGIAFFVLKGPGGSSIGTTGLGLTQRATEADFSFIEDTNLRKHFVAQANQTKYRTKTYSEAADITFINEVEIKSEEFNTRDIEQNSSGQETKHKIQLGDTTYVKDYSDNAWWKQTITPEELPEVEFEEDTEPIDYKEEYSNTGLEFNFLGNEACGPSTGLNCFKYEQTTGGPEGMAFSRIFWFDEKDFLLRKEQSTVGEFGASIEYSYDNINITPPSPVKDVPAGGNVYDYYYGSAATQMPADASAPTGFDYGEDFTEEDAQKLLDQYGY